jgi:hypothetical protein
MRTRQHRYTAHVRSSRYVISYIQPRATSYTPMHTCMPTYQHTCMPCTYTCLRFSAQRNSIYHAQTCPTTTHSCEQAMYCTHWSVWSVELWASAAAMCCAPSAPMELWSRLYAHVCVRRAIQHTCVAHDARSHTYNRVRGHIYPCIHACRHTKCQQRVHALHVYLLSFQCTTQLYMSCTNASHSCELLCTTHRSVWSVELWASAAAMCCAPSVPMEFAPRLYAHMCARMTIQGTCVAHDARSYTYNRERDHVHPCIRACRHTKYKHTCMPCTCTYLHSSAQRNHVQTCPTTTHSCEQAMYCTHLSVWSVDLWASTAAMCCAPSAPMEFLSRLYAHVRVRRTIQHTSVAHDAQSHTHNRERGHMHRMPTY